MGMNKVRETLFSAEPTLLRPQVILSGREEVLIEGYQKLLQYREERIVLKLRGMQAAVSGKALRVKCFAPDRILLGGEIESLTLTEDSV